MENKPEVEDNSYMPLREVVFTTLRKAILKETWRRENV